MADDTASAPTASAPTAAADVSSAPAAPATALTDPVRDLLRKPNAAVIATIGRHGQPVSAATWYALQDDDTVLFNIEDGRARIRHLAADPRFALTVLAENWYAQVSLQGHVVRTWEDSDLSDIDRISTRYTGHAYPVRDKRRLSYRGVIDTWFGWHVD
jgi:PPOX class probable F420-dependent enzyme